MRTTVLSILILAMACSSDKKYILRISQMDPETQAATEKVVNIPASSDSNAFKSGCSEYWAVKAAALEINKKFEGTPGYPPIPVPFYFTVERSDGTPVNFEKDVAERMTFETVNYYQTKVIPSIDTIIPMAKKPKTEPPKIY